MALETRRYLVLQRVLARVQAIRRTNGYATDVGRTVFQGAVPELGDGDPDDAAALLVGEDAPTYQGENIWTSLPITVVALAKANLDNPLLTIETVLADLKRAIELEDRTLGGIVPRQIVRGPTRPLEREVGSQTLGVALTYVASFAERWGHP